MATVMLILSVVIVIVMTVKMESEVMATINILSNWFFVKILQTSLWKESKGMFPAEYVTALIATIIISSCSNCYCCCSSSNSICYHGNIMIVKSVV